VALDCDVLDETEVPSFMPEPGGLSVDEVDTLFKRLVQHGTIVGAGLSGLRLEPLSIGPLERLTATLGL
jgi:arginase family enzyme